MAGRSEGYREEPRRPPGQSRASSLIPAPGGLEIVQAFLNTTPTKKKADELVTPRDLADWMTRNGLLPAEAALTAADLGRARDIRAGLRTVAASHNRYTLNEAQVARLDQASVGARAQVRFDRDGTSRLELISRDIDDALGALLGIVHAARCDGKWLAFKLCGDPKCHRAFFDFTKNASGRWCTRRCGDRMRATTHRRRNKR